MIGQQSGDHRPNDVQNPASVYRRFFDKMSSTDRLAIVGRLTPDDRVTIDGYHDVNFLTKSADCPVDHRATFVRRFIDEKNPENRRIGQRNF